MPNIFELLFLSTEVWGYFGVTGTIVLCMLFSKAVKHSWFFLIALQVFMVAEYLTLGSDYFWHIVLLACGSLITLLIGNNKL